MDPQTNSGPLAALTNYWSGLTPAQKATVSAFAALSIVAVFIVSIVATRPSKATLFSGLQSQDAGVIVAKLEEMKVPYELSADGTAIKVPEKKVHNLRLTMAAEGLPQGGSIGFELLDKNNFGMTEFRQRVDYQRALQGELSRTIGQLSQVSNARVHITVPEEKLFVDQKEESTASVVLKLKPGVTLREEQVAGIVHLVSASVEGLKPNNVTVVDTNGNVLSEGGDEGGMASTRLTSAQSKLKRDYEKTLQRDLQSMLDRVVGTGKSIVRVSVAMNFDRKEMTNQVFEPLEQGRGVLVSQEQTEETYNGAGPGANAAPGVPNNMQGPTFRRVGSSDDTYHRTQSSSKYEVTKRVEQIVSSPGNVEKLSVAVLLDEKVERRQIPAIQQTVQAAAGIDADRGDVVTVQQARFDNTETEKQEKEMASAARTATYVSIGKNLLAVLLLIGFMLFLRSLFKSMKVPDNAKHSEPVQLEEDVQSVPDTYVPFEATVDEPTLDSFMPVDMEEPPSEPEPLEVGSNLNVERVANLARNKPEDVARLIKDWISEK